MSTKAKKLGLQPWMRKVLNSPARFKVVDGGRRIRKTDFCLKWLVLELMTWPTGSVGWYTCPTYRQAKMVAWRRLMSDILPEKMIVRTNEADLMVEIPGKRYIELKGCDNYDSLRGGGPCCAANDEYAYSDPYAWEEVIQPALADKLGKAVFVSTPHGRNHFYSLWRLGWDGGDSDWQSWKFPTREARTVPRKELDRQRLLMSRDRYAQEWEGEFLGHIGLIIPEFIPRPYPEGNFLPRSMWEPKRKKCTHYGGMDWGIDRQTVHEWVGCDSEGRVIFWDEYADSGRTVPEVAQVIKGRNLKYKEAGMKVPYAVLDRSAWRREGMRDTVAGLFGTHGVPVTPAEVKSEDVAEQMRTMCVSHNNAMPLLMVVEGECPVLVEQMVSLENLGKGKTWASMLGHQVRDAFDAGVYAVAHRKRAPRMRNSDLDYGTPRIKMEETSELDAYSGVPF